ncbi:MAG: zinc ribbon domain-containing protein [Nitrospiraceae bacterium]|nr:zinc ribbon domain-containing protein [Nitrospiraceae bacterium]
MPLFHFVCTECQARSEILVRGGEPPVCPHCGATDLVKQASAFAPVASDPGGGLPESCRSCCSLNNGTCPNQ